MRKNKSKDIITSLSVLARIFISVLLYKIFKEYIIEYRLVYNIKQPISKLSFWTIQLIKIQMKCSILFAFIGTG